MRSRTSRLRQQVRQFAADPVGSRGGAFRQSVAMHIHPDRVDTEALGSNDFPFQIVADHPCVRGVDAKRLQCMAIGLLVRLAEALLALDLDMIEAVRQSEALDLGA